MAVTKLEAYKTWFKSVEDAIDGRLRQSIPGTPVKFTDQDLGGAATHELAAFLQDAYKNQWTVECTTDSHTESWYIIFY